MNIANSLIRIAIILTLSFVACAGILSNPIPNTVTWIAHLIVSKGLGVAAFGYACRLYSRWAKVDPWLMVYDKMCNEVSEAPNHAYIGKDSED